MKHTIILLALCALFASCNMGGEIAKLQKENDSLRKLVPQGLSQGSSNRLSARASAGALTNKVVIPVDTSLIRSDTAISYINSWQQLFTNQPNFPLSWDSAGFIISLSEMDTIAKYFCDTCPVTPATALLIYPGVKNGKLTILYSPLGGGPGIGPNNDWIALYPIDPIGHTYLFDHILPCPKCGILGGIPGPQPPLQNDSKKKNK